MSTIKVGVRLKPIEIHQKCIITVCNNQAIIEDPDKQQNKYCFPLDFGFGQDTSQTKVHEIIYPDTISLALKGYNSLFMAYGQTGSGKSYTLFGNSKSEEKGLIYLFFENIFKKVDKEKCFIEVSFIQIYKEKIYDLLNIKKQEPLRIRKHNVAGIYIEDVTSEVVESLKQLNMILSQGLKSRAIAATRLNSVSSRSHAVISINITCQNSETDKTTSKTVFVDLAGNEKLDPCDYETSNKRFSESVMINKSLSTLGKVIYALSEKARTNSKNLFVPFRESVLTYLLKESLTGNSAVSILATLNPASPFYRESLTTLRFIERAKLITCEPKVNEANSCIILPKLQAELEVLKLVIKRNGITSVTASNKKDDIIDRLINTEKLIRLYSQTNEEKIQCSEESRSKRETILADLGIYVENSENTIGLSTPNKCPYLINLNEDPQMAECLIYCLKQGITRVGSTKSTVDMKLTGCNILEEHCFFINLDGVVKLKPCDKALCFINGTQIKETTLLHSGDRVVFGKNQVFRFNFPEPAQVMLPHDLEQSLATETVDWVIAKQEILEKEGVHIEEHIDNIQSAQQAAKQEEHFCKELLSVKEKEIALWSLRKWKGFQFRSILDKMNKFSSLVQEANTISQELNKKLHFSFALITSSFLNPMPDLLTIKESKWKSDFPKKLLAIQVENLKTQEIHIWSLKKLRQRLEQIRDQYCLSISETSCESNLFSLQETDPFEDGPSKFLVDGRAYVQTDNLFYPFVYTQRFAILDDHGIVRYGIKVFAKVSNEIESVQDESETQFASSEREAEEINTTLKDISIGTAETATSTEGETLQDSEAEYNLQFASSESEAELSTTLKDLSIGTGSSTSTASCKLTIKGTSGLTIKQINLLFDLVPGFLSCNKVDETTACVSYSNANSAIYALGKINGFELIIGKPLEVKMMDEDLRHICCQSAGNVEAVEAVTKTINDSILCNIQLPSVHPTVHAEVVFRLFFVCQPPVLCDEILTNIFSIFGNLQEAFLIPGKNFGFAKFTNKDSAMKAKQVLNGQSIYGVKLKVLDAKEKGS